MKGLRINLGMNIGQVKGLQNIENGIYLGNYGGFSLDICTEKGIRSFNTHKGIKSMDLPVFAKAKNGIITIHKIIKQ